MIKNLQSWRVILVMVTAFSLIPLFSLGTVRGQNNKEKINLITVEISSPKLKYQIGEKIPVIVKIQNTTDGDVIIEERNLPAEQDKLIRSVILSIEIQDEKGSPIVHNLRIHVPPPVPPGWMIEGKMVISDIARTLKPKEKVSVEINDLSVYFPDLKKKGKYSVRFLGGFAFYKSYLPYKGEADKKYVGDISKLWSGVIESNIINFEVCGQ